MRSSVNLLLAFFSLFFILTLHNRLLAQQTKTWPSAIDYKLKGKVKTWTMKSEAGVVRKQEFNRNGELIKDSYKSTPQSYIPPEYLPQKLKLDFEKIYTDTSASKDSATKTVYNKRMQLIKKQTPNYYEINKFTEKGKIRVHKSTEAITQTRAWNSPQHASPTYTFTDTLSLLVIYTYHKAGLLTEFEYYHADPFKNIRMVYIYDDALNLIESNRYDQVNILSNLITDDYLKKIIDTEIDSGFSINNFYSNYWGQGTPTKMTWKYNNSGQKTEYIAYGYLKGPSFKATWEYNDKGQLTREIHHDVYHDSFRSIIEYDLKGNVIKETDFDYWAKKEYRFNYEIVYY